MESRFPTFSRVSRPIPNNYYWYKYLAFLHSVGYQDLITDKTIFLKSRFPTFSRVSRQREEKKTMRTNLAFLHSVGYQDLKGKKEGDVLISLSYIQ